jgi:hypothetical protein
MLQGLATAKFAEDLVASIQGVALCFFELLFSV